MQKKLAEIEARLANLEHKLGLQRPGLSQPAGEFLTPKQAAERLGMPLPTMYYHLQRGNIPSVRLFGRIKVSVQTLQNIEQ